MAPEIKFTKVTIEAVYLLLSNTRASFIYSFLLFLSNIALYQWPICWM